MNCNWSMDEAEKWISNLLSQNKDIEKKETLKYISKELKNLEKGFTYFKYFFPILKSIKYIDTTRLFPFTTFREYMLIPNFIQKSILDTLEDFKRIEDSKKKYKLPPFKVSKQQLIEMSSEFYKKLPNKTYHKLFLEYTNHNNHLLYLQKSKNKKIFGETIATFTPTYRPYFFISLTNTLNDFITLNHEIAHGIFLKNDPNCSKKKPHFYLTELEGIFFDFLSWKYIEDQKWIDKITLEKIEEDKVKSMRNALYNFFLMNQSINSLKRGYRILIGNIQKNLKQRNLPIDINREILADVLKESPTTTALYLFSALVSLDLENIFDKDPEYAFFLFEKIRINKTVPFFDNLRKNEITFFEDDYKNLKEKINKISLKINKK